MAKPKNIHSTIRERCLLARTYAEDGAFHSAARVLEQAAAEVKAHAEKCDAWMAAQMAGAGQ